MRHVIRLVIAALLVSATPAITAASSGQVTTTATLSLSIEVAGVSGAPPTLDLLVATPLELLVVEQSCGGPTFIAAFVADGEAAAASWPPGSDPVTTVDAADFRVDVQVPASVDGTDCEYTIDPLGSNYGRTERPEGLQERVDGLQCYETVDVVADPGGAGQVLSLAGVPTGEVVAPGEGEVVEVLGSFADACGELRLTVEGIGGGRPVVTTSDMEPLDPADFSRTCDFGDYGSRNLSDGSGQVVLVNRPTPCSVVFTVAVEGCTVTPSPDSFTMEHPVTERRFVATCAQVPPATPVGGDPTFTG